MVEVESLGHIDGLLLHRLLEDLAIELSTVISILDNSRYLDSARPIVVIEALEVGKGEESVLIEGSVIGQLDITGRGAGTLGDILGHHEELESTGR